jgi:myo-inositol-1(or 4)-monophosphatase
MHKEIKVLLEAVRLAGSAVLKLTDADINVQVKGLNDIVTRGDFLVNEILQRELSHHFPADGWLSEETADDSARLQRSRVWIVDPIDGTREFAKGIPEYAISVALVEDGVPKVCAVCNPAKNELFHASIGEGAWLNGERVHCIDSQAEPLILLASRSEYQRGEWERFIQKNQVQVVGSIAYKLALVAAGKAHGTFSLGPKHEWDIAAGVLLVQEAGGVALTKEQQPIYFNQANIKVDGIVATSRSLQARLFELIK